MSNAIQFLETLGRNPTLLKRSTDSYSEAVEALDVHEMQRQALLLRDIPALGRLLDARAAIYCMITAPDEQSPTQMPGEDEGIDVPDEDIEPDQGNDSD